MLITLFERADRSHTTTIEWTELMRKVRSGKWRNIVERCRGEAVGSDELRQRLPAFGVSVTFIGGNEAANVVKYTNIVAFDFDKSLSRGPGQQARLEECRAVCASEPSVVGFYMTKGGRGFRVFVRVGTGISSHKSIYHPLQEYFERLLGLQANDRYMDITRLSFVSYDPDCFFRRVEDVPEFDLSRVFPGEALQRDTNRIEDIAANVMRELRPRYDLRYNVMEGAVQLRVASATPLSVGDCRQWRNMDDRIGDRLVRELNDNGLAVTYNQFWWLMQSAGLVPTYDAVADYIGGLPAWDGADHVALLAGRLGVAGDDFAPFLRSWMADMVKVWMGNGANKRVLLLDAEGRSTTSTAWAMDLVPQPLAHYVMPTVAQYAKGWQSDGRTWLLAVVMDFDGKAWDLIEGIMASHPRASVIVTSHGAIGGVPSYVSRFAVGACEGGGGLTPEQCAQLYAQILV